MYWSEKVDHKVCKNICLKKMERQWSSKDSKDSKEFTYIGDRMIAGGRCEAAVTSRIGIELNKNWVD